MTLHEALQGLDFPDSIRRDLVLLDLPFTGFDGAARIGQLIVHRDLAAGLLAIFAEIAEARFPIAGMMPVVAYKWSDDASMAANNTSAFNYRAAVGKTELSQHAYGRAVDINPVQNPYRRGDICLPPGAIRDPAAPGALLENGPVVAAFETRGFTWGGRWQTLKDWHHFEKRAG